MNTEFWLEMIVEANLMTQRKLAALTKERDELVAILTASSRIAKRNLRSPIRNQQLTVIN